VILAWAPFVEPLPVWDYWPLLLLPLCAGLSVVYKSIRCDDMRRVPREATALFATIIFALIAAAVLIWLLVKVVVN